MSLFRKKPEPPKPDRLGAFRAAVNQSISDMTHDADWVTKIKVAEALEDFAKAVRFEIATKRPLF